MSATNGIYILLHFGQRCTTAHSQLKVVADGCFSLIDF